jgi:hypothetical protein
MKDGYRSMIFALVVLIVGIAFVFAYREAHRYVVIPHGESIGWVIDLRTETAYPVAAIGRDNVKESIDNNLINTYK